MINYPISPDECLALKALRDSSSLREAAKALGCDPAGLARKIQKISSTRGLVQKVANKWQLTDRGRRLVVWTEESIESQKRALALVGSLRLGSSAWFSEAVIVPQLSNLKEKIGEKIRLSLSVPSQAFELALKDGSVDFILTCHPPENPEIEYKQIVDEKWVVIIPKGWKRNLPQEEEDRISFLKDKPFVSHSDMNLDLFFPGLNREITDNDFEIDNLSGIRSAVCYGLGWSIVPQLLVFSPFWQAQLNEVIFDQISPGRKVCLWWLRGRVDIKRKSGRVLEWAKFACGKY